MEKSTQQLLFTKDKPVMVLSVVSVALAFANLVLTFVLLRSHDFKVPVQYVVNDGSVLQSSNWYTLYSLGFFSLLSAAAVVFIAHRVHRGNRLFAIGTLVAYVVVAVVSILCTYALLDLVSGV